MNRLFCVKFQPQGKQLIVNIGVDRLGHIGPPITHQMIQMIQVFIDIDTVGVIHNLEIFPGMLIHYMQAA